MKNVVVVDTVGDTAELHADYMPRFPHVKQWIGLETNAVRHTVPHPHGGMCMEKILVPLWDEQEGVRAIFLRIFDKNGKMDQTAVGGWLEDQLYRLASSFGPLYVNNSWGAYAGDRLPGAMDRVECAWWRKFIADTKSVVMWAAGNNGDFYPSDDNDYPQSCVTDCSDKIGSARRDGRTSEWSGDSKLAPPTAVFWADNVSLLNPVTCNIDIGSGTSFAAPKAVGLAARRGWDHAAFVAFSKERASKPYGYTGALPHPKWGYGWMEFEYQTELKNCPVTIENLYRVTPHSVFAGERWFDYKKVSD
jgi:hypothetical protein